MNSEVISGGGEGNTKPIISFKPKKYAYYLVGLQFEKLIH